MFCVKTNRSLLQSRRAPSGVTSSSNLRSFPPTFHRRGELFSAVRLLNRDSITFSSQWYFSWKIKWVRIFFFAISEKNAMLANEYLLNWLTKITERKIIHVHSDIVYCSWEKKIGYFANIKLPSNAQRTSKRRG